MAEHPILMNTFSVQGILDGRKTQSRRVIKGNPDYEWLDYITDVLGHIWTGEEHETGPFICTADGKEIRCPYGIPGDLLWVKEIWRSNWSKELLNRDNVYYKADAPNDIYHAGDGWKSSLFMPKAAARIWLEIVEVRVERLQDISEQDAIAEGLLDAGHGAWTFPGTDRVWHSAAYCYAALWDAINAKRGYAWDDNPWVWVISFERHK